MKNSILVIVFSFLTSICWSQAIMQASIGIGSTPTRVKIYVKSNLAVSGNISTMNLNVAIPDTVSPVPSLSITNNPFVFANWAINLPYSESGYIHFNITNGSPFNMTIAADVETELMELEFNNSGINSTNISLLTLPDGGTMGFALFFVSGAATTNGSNLYYARAGTTVTNGFSYTYSPFGIPAGTTNSIATLTELVTLPINWLSFDAIKKGNDAVLNWRIANEEAGHHYELLRSTDGSNFTQIATINKTGTGNGIKEYTYTDLGIGTIGVSKLYYRLRQVDIDGRSSLSEIRMLRLNIIGGQISVFPNPVKNGFYVSIPFEKPDNRIVKLNLLSASGQLIKTREINATQASNYYYEVQSLNLAGGQYQLQMIYEGRVLDTKKLFVEK